MPLFKGTAAKAMPGKAIAYITDEKKAAVVSSQNLFDVGSEKYAEQFRDVAREFGKYQQYDKRKYYHFKLSPDPRDGASVENCHALAERLAAKLFPSNQVVIATHTDTGVIHSHLVINAVSFTNGKSLDIRNRAYGQMKDIANNYGAEMGMTPIEWRTPSAAHERKNTERQISKRGAQSHKDELREMIARAKKSTSNIAEFERYLRDYCDVKVRNTGNTISYLHPQRKQAIRGERLGEAYTKAAILEDYRKRTENRQKIALAALKKRNEQETAAAPIVRAAQVNWSAIDDEDDRVPAPVDIPEPTRTPEVASVTQKEQANARMAALSNEHIKRQRLIAEMSDQLKNIARQERAIVSLRTRWKDAPLRHKKALKQQYMQQESYAESLKKRFAEQFGIRYDQARSRIGELESKNKQVKATLEDITRPSLDERIARVTQRGREDRPEPAKRSVRERLEEARREAARQNVERERSRPVQQREHDDGWER